MTDTVGFIRKLPPKLIASFRTTLSEVEEADILLHVVDMANPQFEEQIEVVNGTLQDLGSHLKPTIMVFNKLDALDEDRKFLLAEMRRYPHAVFISAQKGIGIERLKSEIEKVITESSFELTVEIPIAHYDIASRLYELGEVSERVFSETHVRLRLRVHVRNKERVERLLATAA